MPIPHPPTRGCRDITSSVEVEGQLPGGLVDLLPAGFFKCCELGRGVGRTEVFDDGEFAVAFRHDLDRGCPGRGRDFPQSQVHTPILRTRLVSQILNRQPCHQYQCRRGTQNRPR